MELEKQVCSREHGERLKELGVVQDSLFRWTHARAWSKSEDGGKTPGRGRSYIEQGSASELSGSYAAFTVAESLEAIPFPVTFVAHTEEAILCAVTLNGVQETTYGRNYADAAAALRCHLIENKLMTL